MCTRLCRAQSSTCNCTVCTRHRPAIYTAAGQAVNRHNYVWINNIQLHEVSTGKAVLHTSSAKIFFLQINAFINSPHMYNNFYTKMWISKPGPKQLNYYFIDRESTATQHNARILPYANSHWFVCGQMCVTYSIQHTLLGGQAFQLFVVVVVVVVQTDLLMLCTASSG